MCISSQQKQASMFAALVAAFFILSGCWQPRVKNVDEQTRKGQSQQPVATFFVEKAGGSSRPGLITEWEPSLASAVDGSLKMAAQERRTLWEIPEYKFITFYACVKSTANQQPLRTQKFVVSNSSMEFDVQSDERGCFTWTEPYLYSIYNDPKYLREKRTIKNVGNAPGELDVEFAINPWLLDRGGRGQDEVVFLKDQNLPQGLISDTPVVSMMSESKQLWMNDLQAHIINNSEALQHEASSDEDFHLQSKSMGIGGIDIEMNLEMRPVVMLKGMDGRTKSESIGAGRFRVYAYLVATGMGDCRCERMILTPGAPPAIGEVLAADGKLRVPIKARMAYWAVGSNVEVAIRVEAVDTPPTVALKSYEGIYKLGSIDRLEGGARPFLSEVTYDANKRASFNFDRYLSEATNSVKALKEAREAFNLEPYIFKTMDVRFQTIRTGETATTRTVMFRVKTCIVDSLTGRPVRNEGFFIERIRYQAPGLMVQPDPDPRVLPRETDDEGCLTWMDEHVHKYYKPEQYVFPKAIITNQSAQRRSRNEPGKAFSKTLTMVVNPWDEKWTFGADERALLPDYVESIQKREKTPSRFLLYEFTYQTIRFLYDIDEFMNLQVKKTVLLKLYPKALRYSSIVNGRRATEPLRDGIYLMKVAMQKDYLDPASKGIQIVREGNGTHEYVADPDVNTDETQVGDSQDRYTTKTGAQVKVKEHISVVQKLVRVQDGHIITPVELSMRDLRLMKIRSQFLIQLETIDEARLLMANVFNEITNKKIDQFMDQMKEDSPDRKAFDECLIQKTPDFKDQLLAVMDELKTFREAPADVKKTLMREKRAVLSELIKSLRMHPANREVWSEDKSKLLEKQKESKLLGEPLIDENKLNEHYQSLYICDDILAETIKSLTLNDFTVNPAAPVIDLKSLIDFDSGLDRRTFVGPITLIHNSNHSHMRPTDNLDEIFCESGNDGCNELEFDPDQIDNSVYEDSELFGSIRHLVDKNVDDLIERKKQMVKDYYRTMTIESLLYNFLDFTNTKFVSLGGEHLKKYTSGPLSKENLKDLNLSACLKKT
ncbi:MAG: hypothetical protein KDD59_13905, partial [Bdellovibrionales bacterium]|nr:hypothetical protein [Bdellovibrionales bacterium]